MKKVKLLPLLLLLFIVTAVQAKTAKEIFVVASKSIVIVKAFDEKFNLKATGSGVAVKNGEVATNCHVVQEGLYYTVGRGNDFTVATVLYADIERDLCLLVSPEINYPIAVIGAASKLKVGSQVYAIGAPQGLELSLSDGLVSQLRGEKSEPIVQTTAPISPGSSGGGLFDADGRLVGITTLYFKEGQNLNFALPIEWLKGLRSQKNLTLNGSPPITTKAEIESPVVPANAESELPELLLVGNSATSNDKYYLRTSTVRRIASGLVQAWSVRDYSAQKFNKYKNYYYKSSIELHSYNCAERSDALLSVVDYSESMGSGQVLNTYNWKTSELEYSYVIPESIGESMLEKVCLIAK